MKKFLLLFFSTASLYAAPKAVVFDFGGVLAHPDREILVRFLCDSFQLTRAGLKDACKARDAAADQGISEIQFWLQFAEKKDIHLPASWAEAYAETMREGIGIDPEMFALIKQLQDHQIPIGLLSNIEARPAQWIRKFGLYRAFDPCLLSFEIGAEKPDPKAYRILLEKMPFSPGDIVFIDDLSENVDAAGEAGLDSILFVSVKQIQGDLEQRGLFPDIQKLE